MSIASEISRLSSNISDSLDAVATKGVSVPPDSNSDDLPGLITLIEQSTPADDTLSDSSTNPVQNKVVKAAVDAKYTKPSTGIPKSDLASAVQTSLDKADTALQSVPSTYRTAAAQDTIDAGKIDKPSNPASGAFLVWNGTAWAAQTLAAWQGGSY